MESHTQRWKPPGPFHRIGCSPRSNHQAGGGQDPPSMGFFYGFVYRDGETEVVTGDDELSHKFFSRATMRPSRVRTNSLSRQTVVRLVKARRKETTATRSRNGRSIRPLSPSRSRSTEPRVTPVATTRTCTVAATAK